MTKGRHHGELPGDGRTPGALNQGDERRYGKGRRHGYERRECRYAQAPDPLANAFFFSRGYFTKSTVYNEILVVQGHPTLTLRARVGCP